MTSSASPCARNSASLGPASFAARPPPAAGLTMAMKRSMRCVCLPMRVRHGNCKSKLTTVVYKGNLQRLDGGCPLQYCQTILQSVSKDFLRGVAREIVPEQHESVDALEVQKLIVALHDFATQFVGEILTGFEMNDQNKLLAEHGTAGPDVVGGEDAKLLDRQAIEGTLDVFGINIFAFFRDDHVSSAAHQVQMALRVKVAEIAGLQPAIDDRARRQLGFVQVAGHDRLAAHGHFTDASSIWVGDAHFHTGKRLADRVRAEGL